MEIGETVEEALMPDQDDGGCMFEHGRKGADETKNELAGDSGKLRANMTEGKGVGIHSHTECKQTPEPRSTIEIKVLDKVVKVNGRPLPYPLVCAAHHLIPAQATLRDHPLLNFMCQKGKTQTFKDGERPVGPSRVWADVGYDVNGGQNGVWSPGNYGVGGGQAGVDVWKNVKRVSWDVLGDVHPTIELDSSAELDLSDDEWDATTDSPEDEVPKESDVLRAVAVALAAAALIKATYAQYPLAGKNHRISKDNPKWAYVKAAMDKTGVQFHDSHEEYSDQVTKYLDKIANAYENMYQRSVNGEIKCKECEKATRPEGAPTDPKLVGPPTDLVARLVQCSEFFRRHLAPKKEQVSRYWPPEEEQITAKNIYTSKWVKAWISKLLEMGVVIELPPRR